MRNVHYISQTGTSGYANASKGYVYDLIKKGINVKWTTFLCDQSLTAETSEFDGYINKYRNNNIPENEIDTVIIHSTPDIWQKIIEDLKIQCAGKTVIGRTVWEFNKLIPEWVDCINTSQVTEVSVPTKWNKKVFEKSKVNKPIAVDPHLYVDYPYKSYDLKYILENKSTIIYNGDFNKIDFNSAYKFYTIGQLIPRKGIIETISAFCKSFTQKDNVVLFVKTFKLDHSYEEQLKCLEEIIACIRTNSINGNYPPIVFVKENLTYDELQSLHDICDCYVQLTKTEGFGLGIFEAFNKKKEVIVTGYGGHIEFLGKYYDGLIKFELKNINSENKKFFQFDLDESYTWADASIDDACDFMKSKILYKNIRNINKFLPLENKEDILISDGWYDMEYPITGIFRWTSVNCYIKIKTDKYKLIRLVSINENNNKNIQFKVKKIGEDKFNLVSSKEYNVGESVDVLIKLGDVEIIQITSDCFCPAIHVKGNQDYRKLSLRVTGLYFYDHNNAYIQKIEDIKHENDIFYENNLDQEVLVTDYKKYFSYDKNSFYIGDPIKSGIFLFLPNLNAGNLKCLDNLFSYKHSKYDVPIVIFSDSQFDIPSKYKCKFVKIPMYLQNMIDGVWTKSDKIGFWAFINSIKLANSYNWDYFFYYEWDCKVGKDYWYDTIWQEHLSWQKKPIVTGTPVFKCPNLAYGNILHGITEYRSEYAKQCKLNLLVENVSPLALYSNGALSYYDTQKMMEYYNVELSSTIHNLSDYADLTGPWDLNLGMRIFKDFKEKSFERVGWLPSSYSGCGDLFYTQKQRDYMIESGLKVVIHQNKYK